MPKTAYLIMRLLLITVLFIIFFSYAMFQGGFVSWFLFYMMMPFLIYYLLFIIYPMTDWRVKRILPQKSTRSGQAIRIELEVTRKIPFPVSYLVVEEFLPESIEPIFEVDHWGRGFKKSSHDRRDSIENTILYPNFRKHQHFYYQLNQVPRGVHVFKSVRLTATDLFGFITKTITLPLESVLKVNPVDLNVQLNWSTDRNQLGDNIVTSFQTNQSSNVAGAREYVAGDRLAAIHWKQTARSDVLMTKEFDQENNRDGTIMLFGFREQMTYEWNIAMLYALLQVVKNLDMAVDFSYIGNRSITFPADQEWPHLKDAFIAFKPGANRLSIDAVFDQYQRSFVKGQFLLLFTDQLTELMVDCLIDLSPEKHSRMTVYITRSHTTNSETKVLEERLRNYYINVQLMTEQDVKSTRSAVTI